MCQTCGLPISTPCGCDNYTPQYISNNCGCPIPDLDFACVKYHVSGNKISQLDGLSLPNGVNLEVVIEVLDEKIKQNKIDTSGLSYLKQNYTINNLQQFVQSTDTELASLNNKIDILNNNSGLSLSTTNSNSLSFFTSGTHGHTLTGNVNISSAIGNSLSIQTDGLYNAPQSLSVNYTAKTISISGGNTINLSSLLPASTYLGELSADPVTSISGNYWYNTTTNLLRIKIANSFKTIQTL